MVLRYICTFFTTFNKFMLLRYLLKKCTINFYDPSIYIYDLKIYYIYAASILIIYKIFTEVYGARYILLQIIFQFYAASIHFFNFMLLRYKLKNYAIFFYAASILI